MPTEDNHIAEQDTPAQPTRLKGIADRAPRGVNMLPSYEAIYDHGQITWLGDEPPVEKARVIVTMLSRQETTASRLSRTPSARIAGKGKILGDIISPAAPASDWDALK